MKSEAGLKRKCMLIAIALLTFTSVAWAEHGPGNGGNAVLMDDGKYYLLDFVESGIEKSPKLPDEHWGPNAEPYIKNLVMKYAYRFPKGMEEERRLLAEFLDRVESVNSNFAMVLLASLELHTWYFVEAPLKDIPLEDSQIFIPSNRIGQAAVRRGRNIYINRSIWESMNLFNRVGLMIHEAVYSVVPVAIDKTGYPYQSNWAARLVTSGMFRAPHAAAMIDAIALSIGDKYVFNYLPGLENSIPFTERESWAGPKDTRIRSFLGISQSHGLVLQGNTRAIIRGPDVVDGTCEVDIHENFQTSTFAEFKDSFLKEKRCNLKFSSKTEFMFGLKESEQYVYPASYSRPDGVYEYIYVQPATDTLSDWSYSRFSSTDELNDAYQKFIYESIFVHRPKKRLNY